MPEDLNKDRLEDFFKNTFEDQPDRSESNGWDMPGDQVWNTIETAIKKDKKDRKVLWWWIGAGVLLIAFFGLYFIQNGSENIKEPDNNRVENNIPVQEESLVENDESGIKGEELEAKSIESGTRSQELKVNDQESMVRSEALGVRSGKPKVEHNGLETKRKELKIKSKDSDRKSSELTATQQATNLEQSKPNQNQSAQSAKTTLDSTANESIVIDSAVQNEEFTTEQISKENDSLILAFETIEPLATIPTKWSVSVPILKDSISLITKSFPPSKQKISGFYAGLNFGPSTTFRQVKAIGGFNIPDFIKNDEYALRSFSTGVNFGYQFSKRWSIESGFNYSSIALQTRSRRFVRYTALNEQLNQQGEYERNYNLDVKTSGGDINTDIAIARESGTSITENESIAIQLRGKQEVHFGNIPIILRYHLGNKKFQIGLKAGLVNRFKLKGTFQYESAQVIRSGVRLVLSDRFYRVRTLQNLKEYQADFLIGAGIRYHLTDKIWLYAEPTITRSINPIHQNSEFKVFPLVKSIDFGVNYRF